MELEWRDEGTAPRPDSVLLLEFKDDLCRIGPLYTCYSAILHHLLSSAFADFFASPKWKHFAADTEEDNVDEVLNIASPVFGTNSTPTPDDPFFEIEVTDDFSDISVLVTIDAIVGKVINVDELNYD
ncbi:hypothetical protein QNH39_25150 [Neobacillus novalis]|uniref:Uncharacterized protein n=1 Tax=Neobacillus novalis TaxID=220687 RepID=A0AA95MSN4_9BACI|nr:hypothetical protein [Neobacillus novalis]WHY85848.1 hypothetical protein QNH39_25150 [Neobacillus novalis]